jgi:hypothetical protein
MTSSAHGRPWISNVKYNHEYTSWAEFVSYHPYDTHQWKSKVLVWWSIEHSFLQFLFLSPDKGLEQNSWMTVRIGVKGVEEEEIRIWIYGHYGYLGPAGASRSKIDAV